MKRRTLYIAGAVLAGVIAVKLFRKKEYFPPVPATGPVYRLEDVPPAQGVNPYMKKAVIREGVRTWVL